MWRSSLSIALQHIRSYKKALFTASRKCCCPTLFSLFPSFRIHVIHYSDRQDIPKVHYVILVAFCDVLPIVNLEYRCRSSFVIVLTGVKRLVTCAPVAAQIMSTTRTCRFCKQPPRNTLIVKSMFTNSCVCSFVLLKIFQTDTALRHVSCQ